MPDSLRSYISFIHKLRIPFIGLVWLMVVLIAGATDYRPEDYVWNSPSQNSSESMPCGGGDIGMNVWVEKGSLFFYLSRSGAYDENNTLLKAGRFRVDISPNPFVDTADFEQKLNLYKGGITISSGKVQLELWVDVFKPVVHCEIKSDIARTVHLSYESWRHEDRLLQKGESQQNSYKWAPPKGLLMRKDSIEASESSLYFYHHNPLHTLWDVVVNQQGLQNYRDQLYNPLQSLISGGRLIADQFRYKGTSTGWIGQTVGTDLPTIPSKSWNFESAQALKKVHFSIVLHHQQTESPDLWKKNIVEIQRNIQLKADQKKTVNWWHQFWQRSFIEINGEAAFMSRNYTLFRYMLACNAYGSAPTRFNGGLFTFDPVHVDQTQSYTPDYRKWGGGTYTAQNQRLVYWSLLKSGDFDLMLPQFDFYNRLLPTAELRSRVYWDHPGACFTEQMENFGLPNPSEYGWKRPEGYDPGMEYNAWLEYQWETVLEFCQMILETKRYHHSDINAYLPLIESSVLFFTHHYHALAGLRGRKSLDQQGKLILYPASACETYKMAYNPANTIAGLLRVIGTLKALKEEDRSLILPNTLTVEALDSLYGLIPPIPLREENGRTLIAPALSWERINNTEAPQLYPVFPWRFYHFANDSLHIAENTYQYDQDALTFRDFVGWKQDNIFAACLGLQDEAWRLNRLKLADGPYRFPAFWGPGFDWSPDHNHGGSAMIGLQEMLLQEDEDGKLYLFPAWPANQDIHFKLHASDKTVIEAKLKAGELTQLVVIPESRRKDVQIINNIMVP